MIRWYEAGDLQQCHELYLMGHPGAPLRPDNFFPAVATLVIPTASGRLIGMTSWTISFATSGFVAYGLDVVVHPGFRNRGHGRRLHAERCRIAAELGCIDFIGTTTEDNYAMRTIFERQGLKRIDEDGRCFYCGPLR